VQAGHASHPAWRVGMEGGFCGEVSEEGRIVQEGGNIGVVEAVMDRIKIDNNRIMYFDVVWLSLDGEGYSSIPGSMDHPAGC
jgi:hypothetical protein